jgi:DNA-binding HxlR family transcriptional regulator
MKEQTKNSTRCPITEVAKLLSDTWTMLIIHSLMDGPKRFCELESNLDHISTRTLTNKLKQLTERGLIKKDGGGEYMATEKGKGIRIIERAMVKYDERFPVR